MNARAAVAGPIFLARTGLRSGSRDALLAGAMVAVTAFLLTVAPLWFGRTAEGVLRSRLATATVAQRGFEYELRGRLAPVAADPLGAVEAQATELTAELPATIRGSLAGPRALVDSTEFLAVEAPRPLLRVGLRIEDVEGGIRWVAGRAPTSRTTTIELPDRPSREGLSSWANVYEAAISTGTAAETELETGDRILMVPGANTAGFIAIDVVGIFEIIDADDERWFADPTLATAIAERISPEVTIYHAIALVDRGVYPVLHGAERTAGSLQVQFRYRWRYALDPSRVATERANVLATDLARLRAAHPFGGGQGEPSLSTGLADLVAEYRLDRAGAATAVALAMVGPLAAMLGALALMATVAATRRRAAVRVVRSRGGGIAQVVAGRAVEALLVAIPAAVMGSVLAALVSEGRWVAEALVPALAVGLAAGALAALPALGAARSPSVGREPGPGGRVGRRRLVLDLLVVTIAVAGAASLGRRDVGAADELNLLLASVPVLVALGGSVLVLRLYPAAVRIAARASAARTDLVAVHGLRAVSRGAAGQQIPLVALALAMAMGVFSAFVVGTLDRGEARAASEVVGADARVEGRSGAQLPDGLRVGAVAGVELTATAARTDGSLIGAGRISASVDVVALDMPAWLDVVDGRALDAIVPADLARRPLLDAGTATSPVAAIIGAETAGRLGLAPGDVALLTVGGHPISVRLLETRARFPGLGPVGEAVIVDLAAARVALPDVPLPAHLAFIRMTAAAKPGLEAAVGRYGAVVTLGLRDQVLDDLRASPLVGAIRTGFGVAVLVSLLYAVAVVAVATRQAVLARRRELAVLHALGLAPRSVVRLLALEVGPLVVAALVTGIGMGLVIAWLVVPTLALGQLVHLATPAVLAGDPLVLLALGLAPAAGAAVAVAIGAHGIGRMDLADATRAVDP